MFFMHPSHKNISDIETPLVCVITENYQEEIKTNFSNETAEHILRAFTAHKFKGKAEETFSLLAPFGLKTNKIIFASIGDEKRKKQAVENTSGNVADRLYRTEEKASLVFIGEASKIDSTLKSEFMMGFHLKCYNFDHYFTDQKEDEKAKLTEIHVYDADEKNLTSLYDSVLAIVQGVFFARNLVSEPANILYPESYADRCEALSDLGLKIKVLGEEEMAEQGMFCLLGVGQGSVRESKTVILEWNGKQGDKEMPLALVGKGVCFDTGGISLKAGKGMWDMIFDMGGSAAVVGTMIALASRKAPVNVVGIIGLVENMPDGNAQRPGDVVKTMAGKTVEVLNTDAEGRLVLADIMWYVQEHYKPKMMIDLATLTGAIIMSLAHEYAGIFSNNDEFADKLIQSGQNTGDKLWRMPMGEAFSSRLKSRVADLANIAMSPEGGSITAACFLEKFVQEGVTWAHLDIAGTAWSTEPKPTFPKGATGFGVRLLNDFIKNNLE